MATQPDALGDVFSNAATEEAVRKNQAAALDSLLAGPEAETVSLLKNIDAAAEAVRKSFGLFRFFNDDAAPFSLKLAEGRVQRTDDDSGYQKSFRLGQGYVGFGVVLTFRDNGTLTIAQEKTSVITTGPRTSQYNTDAKQVYSAAFDASKAREQIGGFLARVMGEEPRRKLETALRNLPAARSIPPQPK